MSALAHFLEEAGFATVAISLVRPQSERTRPPRALWVPFELGRPFGAPDDAPFQKRVLMAALELLERSDGPVLLEDFPDDDPRRIPDPAWRAPETHAPAPDTPLATLADELASEIASLLPLHAKWVATHDRTTVGLSGLDANGVGQWVGAWLRGEMPPSPREGVSAPLLLRYAIDDLKAYYLEAAQATGSRPSSAQLGDWFWNATVAGAAIRALREHLLAGGDDRLKVIANFLVPTTRQVA